MKKNIKRPFTLLEIMVVIFLIAIIGSVIGFNMKGGLDEGRKFKTEEAMNRIEELLLLEIAKGATLQEVVANPAGFLEKAGIVKDVQKLLVDGWGTPFEITSTRAGHLTIKSDALTAYNLKKKKMGEKGGKASTDESEEQ